MLLVKCDFFFFIEGNTCVIVSQYIRTVQASSRLTELLCAAVYQCCVYIDAAPRADLISLDIHQL